MMDEPQKRISTRALKVWRISGIIFSFITLSIVIGVSVLTFVFDWPKWIIAIGVFLYLLDILCNIILFPTMKWKRWRYEVREQEVEIQHGIFVVKRTLVPMVRVQHVDTRQGPLLRKYSLATVTISTAATLHEIPALDMHEAEEMRLSISRLARVVDEDV
jgi:uncharacterized protein